MTEYEISYISSPNLAEDARGELDAAIDSSVEKAEGNISHNSESIRRRLVYPIQKQSVGFVRTLQVSLNQDKIEKLRQDIRKMSGILRVSVLATPRRAEVSTSIFEVTKEQPAEKKPTTPAKAISMEEVEEKIEEALDEEVK
ncbi:MAG: 30S ribosomal protein S6 [Candidatus Andersenbacteria bacterium]|nr:30S ribosomal protein S6 [Candidatus Andersenbacteria bacterium]